MYSQFYVQKSCLTRLMFKCRSMCVIIIWAIKWYFGTYGISEQQMLKRACVRAVSLEHSQLVTCTQSMEVDECTDQDLDL